MTPRGNRIINGIRAGIPSGLDLRILPLFKRLTSTDKSFNIKIYDPIFRRLS